MSTTNQIRQTIDHLFRYESGKLVSVLTKVFGPHNIELAEDVVQDTLLKAMHSWKMGTIPDNPTAWLMTVARNKAIDIIRKEKRQKEYAANISYLLQSEYTLSSTIKELVAEEGIEDDLLRMMFTCCHPLLAAESQVALILRTLCGFSITEIAKAFITTPDTIEKRIYRAKQLFREGKVAYEIPSGTELEQRLDNVLTAIYLLFNEGYTSAQHEVLVRKELQDEAIRLGELLIKHKNTATPAVYALLALMCVTAARNEARLDKEGNILLLSQQDRGLWNKDLIRKGLSYMERSAVGDEITVYHIEAMIACEYVMADHYENTNWQAILRYYDVLFQLKPSPVVALNRAVVLAELNGPEDAIRAIHSIKGKDLLNKYYLYHSILGDLYHKTGSKELANQHIEQAIRLTANESEKKLLRARLNTASTNKV